MIKATEQLNGVYKASYNSKEERGDLFWLKTIRKLMDRLYRAKPTAFARVFDRSTRASWKE